MGFCRRKTTTRYYATTLSPRATSEAQLQKRLENVGEFHQFYTSGQRETIKGIG